MSTEKRPKKEVQTAPDVPAELEIAALLNYQNELLGEIRDRIQELQEELQEVREAVGLDTDDADWDEEGDERD